MRVFSEDAITCPVPCLGPRSTRSCGGGAQTLEGAATEWEKFRLELKRAIPGYATDVFVMLELKTKLLLKKPHFVAASQPTVDGDWLCGGEG